MISQKIKRFFLITLFVPLFTAGGIQAMEDKNNCSICAEKYGNEFVPVQFACNKENRDAHVFCLNCALNTVKNDWKMLCPFCRAPLVLYDPTATFTNSAYDGSSKSQKAISRNIPSQGKILKIDYNSPGIKNKIGELKEYINTSKDLFVPKIEEVEQPIEKKSKKKSSKKMETNVGIETFIGLGLGLLVGREFEPKEKETSPRLKIARTLYVPALFGGFTLFDNSKNRGKNLTAKSLGMAAGLAISYVTRNSISSKQA